MQCGLWNAPSFLGFVFHCSPFCFKEPLLLEMTCASVAHYKTESVKKICPHYTLRRPFPPSHFEDVFSFASTLLPTKQPGYLLIDWSWCWKEENNLITCLSLSWCFIGRVLFWTKALLNWNISKILLLVNCKATFFLQTKQQEHFSFIEVAILFLLQFISS